MSSFFRIGGLASGLDTNTIIEQLMAIERQPITRMQAKQDILTWKKDFWSGINSTMSALMTTADALLENTTILAKLSASSDETILTATATSGAAVGTYNITEIESLATATKVTSGGSYIGTTVVSTEAISSDSSRFGTTIAEGTFTIRGVQFTLSDESGDGLIDRVEGPTGTITDAVGTGLTMDEIITHLNSVSANTGVTASLASDELTLTNDVAHTGQEILLSSAGDTSNFLSATYLISAEQDVAGDGSKTSTVHLGHARVGSALSSGNFGTTVTGDVDGNGTFKINGVEINYNINEDTLAEVISRINNSTAGVIATCDSMADKLILTSEETGAASILREDVTGNFLDTMELLDTDSPTVTSGTNAKFKVEGFNGGDWIYSNSNTISNLIDDVTFTLKDTLALADGPVTLDVTHDATKAKDNIKDFVNKYNALMTLINTKLNEKKVMEPETITEKKQGLLRGNRVLIDAKIKIGNIIMNTVSRSRPGEAPPVGENDPLSDALDQLSEIGITIDSSDYGKSGQLVINEDLLDEKLRENPGGVAEIFLHDSEAGEDYDGVAQKMSNLMDYYTDSRTDLVGSASVKVGVVPRQQEVLQDQIGYFDDRIDDMEYRLGLREEHLIKKFTAMESMLAQMQSMGSWLSTQIAGMFE